MAQLIRQQNGVRAKVWGTLSNKQKPTLLAAAQVIVSKVRNFLSAKDHASLVSLVGLVGLVCGDACMSLSANAI